MKRMWKLMAALLLVATLLSASALGETYRYVDMSFPEVEIPVETMLDSDEALEGYFRSLLGMDAGNRLFQPRRVGNDLTGIDRVLYDYLSGRITAVAAGDIASTSFEVPLSVLGVEGRYSAADLGVSTILNADNTINSEASAALKAKVKCDLSWLTRALLWDHPYEMYWFDKTTTVTAAYPKVRASYTSSHTNDRLFFSGGMVFRFSVVNEYADDTYVFNTDLADAAKTAANNARAVVRQYANVPDYDKLKGYKDRILAMTSYNHSATTGTAYGNPWQLIWVFDGNDSTAVVCEGYAKAFQYLCDMTEFVDDSIYCFCAGGYLSDQEQNGHMWNIVHMPNGKNYMVDLTNCDTGTRGAPDKLFMVGCDEGSPDTYYTFWLNGAFPYRYNSKTTLKLFNISELTLSPYDYLDDIGLPVDAAHFPDARFRECVSAKVDTNASGRLSPKELAATTLNASGMGIQSLGGIEYLTALTELNVANNQLTALDLTLIPNVTVLNCSGNAIAALDLTKHAALSGIVSAQNRSWSAGVKTYRSGRRSLTCNLDTRLNTGRTAVNALILPGQTQTVGESAFEATFSDAVMIPRGCQSIGARAFAYCPNLYEVYIPASVTAIADDAFTGSEETIIFTPSASVRQWAAAHGLTSVYFEY